MQMAFETSLDTTTKQVGKKEKLQAWGLDHLQRLEAGRCRGPGGETETGTEGRLWEMGRPRCPGRQGEKHFLRRERSAVPTPTKGSGMARLRIDLGLRRWGGH